MEALSGFTGITRFLGVRTLSGFVLIALVKGTCRTDLRAGSAGRFRRLHGKPSLFGASSALSDSSECFRVLGTCRSDLRTRSAEEFRRVLCKPCAGSAKGGCCVPRKPLLFVASRALSGSARNSRVWIHIEIPHGAHGCAE